MADPGNPRKILLVDDEPQVTYMVGSLLNRMGQNYKLLLATTKDKALQILAQEKPGVILLRSLVHPFLFYETRRREVEL